MEQRIGHRFNNAELLERALTHKSFANENRVPADNERLEFLGDAVLNLVVSEYLMRTCPDSNEGDLSRLRAAVVSEPALAIVAREIGLGELDAPRIPEWRGHAGYGRRPSGSTSSLALCCACSGATPSCHVINRFLSAG